VAAPSEWALAYLEQARADMRGADLVQAEEPSVLAMLLQMVLEKLGKAALLRSGNDAQLVVFEALPHAFWYNFGLPETKEALELMAKFFDEKVGR